MNTDGPILKKVFDNGGYNKQQQESTLKNAIRIYERIPNNGNKIEPNVGIVVGRVQSGKTANIITLSALALDNGHKLVVLFLSDTNNLLTQNTERLEKCFKGIKDVLVFKQAENVRTDLELDKDTLEVLHEEDKKLIICSLKHKKHIGIIKQLISDSPYKNDYAMIIDDEGDDIGLNTKNYKDRFSTDENGNVIEKGRTATNKAIIELKETLSKVGYISLTATPEANILLQNFQQLAPDFCVTLEPNSGYTGLISFHGEDSNCIVEIDDFISLNQSDGLPHSFEKAFVFYIAGCIVRKNRENGREFKHSMMIHPCHRIENHNKVFEKIRAFTSQRKSDASKGNDSSKRFLAAVREEYKRLMPDKDIDHDAVYQVLKRVKVHEINNKSSNNDLKSIMKLSPYNIVVGGNMLDRGITIEGLAVTYMIRMAKQGQADTLLQRARWFGYKRSYIDLCRVYIPGTLKIQFSNLIEMEESIWQFLYECDEKCLKPKDMLPYFTTPKGMKLTAGNKAKYITTTLLSFVKVQTAIVQNKQYNKKNIELIKSINWTDSELVKYNSTQTHRKKSVPADSISEIFRAFKFSEADENSLSYNHINYFIKQMKTNLVDLWDMRYESKQKRSTDGYNIKALLQGYSEGLNPNDKDYYPGDRQLRTSNLSIQIHHVILKNDIEDQYKTGDEVIMIAIILPKDYIGTSVSRKLTKDEITTHISKLKT